VTAAGPAHARVALGVPASNAPRGAPVAVALVAVVALLTRVDDAITASAEVDAAVRERGGREGAEAPAAPAGRIGKRAEAGRLTSALLPREDADAGLAAGELGPTAIAGGRGDAEDEGRDRA
jgi:hypothetical protein